jgi:hypothetical protein
MIEEGLRDVTIKLSSQMPFKVNSAIIFGSHAIFGSQRWRGKTVIVLR